MEFMPHNAPLVVLTFLGTWFLLGMLGIAFIYSMGAKSYRAARLIFLAGCGVAAIYGGLLLIASAQSEEKTLAAGQLKYFCEIDCHAAYSISSVTAAKALGSGEKQATAAGTFYVVTVRTWFDGKTISSRRPKDVALWPNPREVWVVDEQGRRFSTSLAGLKALGNASAVPISHPLRPGESYETTLVFDLPDNSTNLRLLLADWDPVTHLLIGHENSFFHKKIFFRLEPPAQMSSQL